MKSFERLMLSHPKGITGPLLDPLQFAYRANRSVADAVNMGLHYILRHLDTPEAHPARGACLHLSMDHQLPDQQETAGDPSVKLDTTLIGLIRDGDKDAYRQVEWLVHWCSQNHPELNPLKTVKIRAVDSVGFLHRVRVRPLDHESESGCPFLLLIHVTA
ncbi:uncharacterized protein ACBT44_022318 isoform 2-T2 [Syngnathus typhle]